MPETRGGTDSPSGTESHGGRLDQHELVERMNDRLEDLRERMGHLGERASEVVRANPVAALVGAGLAGFLLARLVSRR